MEIITGSPKKRPGAKGICSGGADGRKVEVYGAVHALRGLGGITVLTLRLGDGVLQCVCGPQAQPEGLCEECCVRLSGLVRPEGRAPGGREVAALYLADLRDLELRPGATPLETELLTASPGGAKPLPGSYPPFFCSSSPLRKASRVSGVSSSQ